MIKDIDPNFMSKSTLDYGVAEKIGYDAFVIAFKNLIETEIGELPDQPEFGTNIMTDYVFDNVNFLGAIAIKNKIEFVVKEYLKELNLLIEDIQLTPDFANNEYVVNITVKENEQTEENMNLAIPIKVKR